MTLWLSLCLKWWSITVQLVKFNVLLISSSLVIEWKHSIVKFYRFDPLSWPFYILTLSAHLQGAKSWFLIGSHSSQTFDTKRLLMMPITIVLGDWLFPRITWEWFFCFILLYDIIDLGNLICKHLWLVAHQTQVKWCCQKLLHFIRNFFNWV